jgi:ataxia telangiectasia mutated family protein
MLIVGYALRDVLNDKACHKIFEALFRCVAIEKSIYNRSSRSNARGQSAPRLPLCASVFRVTVEVSLSFLQTRTIHAILDHIIQTITEPGEGLWEYLANDYIKCLRALLEYPTHVEHLGESEWLDTMSFCLRCLGLIENNANQLSIRTSHRSSSEALAASNSRSTPSRTLSGRNVASPSSQNSRTIVDETVVCVQLLTASPNAPIGEVSERVLNGLLDYLISSAATNAIPAFKAINTILTKVMWDQSTFVGDFILELIPVNRRLWTTKSTTLKDEILISMVLCMDLLHSTVQSSPNQATIESLQGLETVLQSDYVRRSERDLLQIEDLIFYQTNWPNPRCQNFGPRLGNIKSEHNWTLVWTISCILAILDDLLGHLPIDASDNDMPNKRQRLSSRIGDVARDCISSTGTRKAFSLQLLSFLEHRMTTETKATLLESLAVNIVDDNSYVATWTLLSFIT